MTGFAEGTPTVEITLAGKNYTLGFTIGAMRRAKELGVSDVNLSDGAALMLAIPQYVWACLTKEDRSALSVEEIDELINPLNLGPITEAVGELFKASLPEDTSGNGQPAATQKREPTAGRSTSTSSGQLASTI